jgi:hypothetical protein
VVGATGAFFSDTELSSGNTFAAGALDLKVDNHSYYNGNECKEVTPGVFQWAGNALFPVPGTPCDVSWNLTDLTVQKFFDFLDLKPGDAARIRFAPRQQQRRVSLRQREAHQQR